MPDPDGIPTPLDVPGRAKFLPRFPDGLWSASHWPKEARAAAFDSLAAIEEEWRSDRAAAEDILQRRIELEAASQTTMTKLQLAIAKLENLPRATQETIVEGLLMHLDKTEALRSEIQRGINSLERGGLKELDIDDVIKRARSAYGCG